jgi:hypothetical protein
MRSSVSRRRIAIDESSQATTAPASLKQGATRETLPSSTTGYSVSHPSNIAFVGGGNLDSHRTSPLGRRNAKNMTLFLDRRRKHANRGDLLQSIVELLNLGLANPDSLQLMEVF